MYKAIKHINNVNLPCCDVIAKRQQILKFCTIITLILSSHNGSTIEKSSEEKMKKCWSHCVSV